MLAGMEMRDRSLPMDCLRISHSEKDWFTGCGAGSLARGTNAASSSAQSSADASDTASSSESDPSSSPTVSRSRSPSSDARGVTLVAAACADTK